MLRVGIVGAGDFGAAHARAIAAHDDVEVVAASRTDAAALAEFTGRFGGTGYADYRALLGDPHVDAVLVATPHDRHTAIALAAVEAGRHVLLEKPMAPTLEECDRIVEASTRAGVCLMVGHVNHFVPAYEAARRVLDAGEIGDVVQAHSTMQRPWMTPNRRAWHLDRACGGGMWLTIGVHVIDQLRWLVGADATSVSADLGTRFHVQPADDLGVALIRYASGCAATASVVGYREGVFDFRTEVTGTRGVLRIDHGAGTRIGRGETWIEVPGSASGDWMAEALVREWRAFADAVAHGGPAPVTGGYARHVMATVLAAERSSRERREVPVEASGEDSGEVSAE